MTKLEELSRVAELAAALGPDSYLGQWFTDALPMLRDLLQQDLIPEAPLKMHSDAAAARGEALREAFEIRERARLDAAQHREQGRKEAAAIVADAHADADRIRGRAWQALRTATKALEA
jgi:hypothetical protein